MRDVNGLPFTIRYMKAVKLHITRYACGQPLHTNSAFVSLTNEGFPSKFLYLKEYIDSKSIFKKKVVFTLLSYTRSIIPTNKELSKVQPNLNSITDEYKGKDYTIPSSFIRDFVYKFKLKSQLPSYSEEDHYISSKSSPFGKATISAPMSLFYISESENDIMDHIKLMLLGKFNLICGSFLDRINKDHRNTTFGYSHQKYGISKISIINDPELKFRPIAILDYYSQFILKPIHKRILNLLKNFPCDRTFTQDPHHV
jgi:hypothetical protein